MLDKLVTQKFTRRSFLAGLGASAALPVLAACQPQVITEERVVVVEKEVLVDRVVTQVVQVVREKVVTVEVDRPVEVEMVVTVEVEKAIEVEKLVTVEVEKQVIIEQEKIVERIVEVPATGAELVEVKLSHWVGNFLTPVHELVAEKAGIKISEESVPEYKDKIRLQLASGTAPDAMWISSDWAGELFPTGNFEALDSFFPTFDFDQSRFYWDTVEAGGYNGKTYGLDMYAGHPGAMFINMDLMEELGVRKELPLWQRVMTDEELTRWDEWSWTDFMSFADSIKGEFDGWVAGGGIHNSWGYHAKELVMSNGARVFDTSPNWHFSETKCTLDSPEAIDMLRQIADLRVNEYVPSVADDQAVPGGLFRSGKVFMQFASAVEKWLPRETVNFPMTVIHFPIVKDRVSHVGQDYLTLNSSSKVKDAASKFIFTRITDHDALKAFVNIVGLAPSYDGVEIYDGVTDDYIKMILATGISRFENSSPYAGTGKEIAFHYPIHNGVKAPQFLQKSISDAMQAAALGSGDIGGLIKSAVGKINEEISSQ